MNTTNHTFENIAISEIHQFEGYCLFMRKDNVIQLQFKPWFNGEVEDAKLMIAAFKKIKTTEKALLLVIYDEGNTFSKEVREYIASDDVSNYVKADALVIIGLAQKIIVNGYLKINKPNRPTRVFNTAGEALNWLKQFQE